MINETLIATGQQTIAIGGSDYFWGAVIGGLITIVPLSIRSPECAKN